jgi:hypothetical protein
MGCSCHGKNGVATKVTTPYDQCTACARKHIKAAWSKWGEFTYEEDNRDYCSSQLRDAADHLKYIYPSTALKCRELAMAIEEYKDKEYSSIAEELDKLRQESRDLFYKDNEAVVKRREELING